MARKPKASISNDVVVTPPVAEEQSAAMALEALIPVWFKLPQSFWKELADLCFKTGTKPEKIIQRGLKLCRKELDGQLQPNSKVREGEWINSAYWRTVTPEERKERGRRAAMARWHSNEEPSEAKQDSKAGKDIAVKRLSARASMQATKRRPAE